MQKTNKNRNKKKGQVALFVSHAILTSPSISLMTNELCRKFWWLLYPSIQGHNLQFTKVVIISFGRYEVFTMYTWMTCYLSQGKNSNRAELFHAVQMKMKEYLFSSQIHERSMTTLIQSRLLKKTPTTNKPVHFSLLLTLQKIFAKAFCLFHVRQNPST